MPKTLISNGPLRDLLSTRAYLGASMCQPCRAELIRLLPDEQGAPGIIRLPARNYRDAPSFGQTEYRVGLAGVSGPEKVFPFFEDEGCVLGCTHPDPGSRPWSDPRIHEREGDAQPFCLVVILTEPHVAQVMGDATKYPPKKLKLPPNSFHSPSWEDSSDTSGNHLHGRTGRGHAEPIMVRRARQTTPWSFSVPNSLTVPGCKWTTWDTGLHTASSGPMAGQGRERVSDRRHGPVRRGVGSAHFHQLPGQETERKGFDAVLTGQKTKHRKFTYGMHNTALEMPELSRPGRCSTVNTAIP